MIFHNIANISHKLEILLVCLYWDGVRFSRRLHLSL